MDLVSDRLLHQRCARVEGLRGEEFTCLSCFFFQKNYLIFWRDFFGRELFGVDLSKEVFFLR